MFVRFVPHVPIIRHMGQLYTLSVPLNRVSQHFDTQDRTDRIMRH